MKTMKQDRPRHLQYGLNHTQGLWYIIAASAGREGNVVVMGCRNVHSTRDVVRLFSALEACLRGVESDQTSVAQTLHISLVSGNGLECISRALILMRETAPLAEQPSAEAERKRLERTRSPSRLSKDVPFEYLTLGNDESTSERCGLMDMVKLLTLSSGRPMQMCAQGVSDPAGCAIDYVRCD